MRQPTIQRVERRGRVEFRLRAWEDGRRVIVATYRTRDAAEAGKRGYIADAKRSAVSAELTLGAWVETWLEDLKSDGKRSYRSAKALNDAYLVGSKLAGMGIRKVTTAHVADWIDGLKRRAATRGRNATKVVDGKKIPGKRLSEQTLRNAKHLIGAAYRDAIKAGKAKANPAHGVTIDKQHRKEDAWHYMTLDEIATFLASKDLDTTRRRNTGVRSAFVMAIYSGLREGELWGLRWDDVHLDDKPRVVVRASYDGPTKTGKIRTVPLLPPAVEALRAWRDYKGARKAKGLVWPGKGGRLASYGHDASWPALRDLAGLRRELRFHDLRHTCASHLVSGSWGRAWRLEEVCEVLGHSELKTTQRYAHLSPESILGAADEAREQWAQGGGCQVGAAPVIPIR